MGKEIERKFLVKSDTCKKMPNGILYKQGYLCSEAERVVRVRLIGHKAYITIKGKNVGAIRDEYEYEIAYKDAEEIIEKLCEKPIIEKIRYMKEYDGFTWEIDEFYGENEGLTIAEIELKSETEVFSKPDWVGEEVTDNPRYYNSNLIKNPYKNW
jgi:CYTH domain-containing protein